MTMLHFTCTTCIEFKESIFKWFTSFEQCKRSTGIAFSGKLNEMKRSTLDKLSYFYFSTL